MKRVRTKHFFVSGAIGGLLGFFLMEFVRGFFSQEPEAGIVVLKTAVQFAVFGLAVGAALGMTEALVQKRYWRLLYGLSLGVVLGAIGGFGGGVAGELIFQLLPQKPPPDAPGIDLAIALDASGSMADGGKVAGNDVDGKRLKAAQQLVDILGERDRVAVVSFSDQAHVHQSLLLLDSSAARKRVDQAINAVGSMGGTNLTAGLQASLGQLSQSSGRSSFVIFLTDGVGYYDPAVLRPAQDRGIKIFTIGLGSGVDRSIMEQVAKSTGGAYYPVEDADKLSGIFKRIYKEEIRVVDMASQSEKGLHDPILLLVFRMLSWAAMGLVIGIGQGIRENTWVDLWACSLGGLVGGLIGGAAFDPIVSAVGQALGGDQAEVFGRVLADVIVGACIGGSMRFAQGLVVQDDRPARSMLSVLPQKSSALTMQPPRGPLQAAPRRRGLRRQGGGMRGLVLSVKEAIEQDGTPGGLVAPESASGGETRHAEHRSPTATGRKRPLSYYQSRCPDNRPKAMAAAHQSGHHSVAEIAAFFAVSEARVRRAIAQFPEAK